MPSPHAFASLDELHAAISSPRVQDSLERFSERSIKTVRELVRCSVAGNTFRAFPFRRHKIDLSPSDIFRAWTTSYLEREYRSIVDLQSFEAMIDHVCAKAAALDQSWYESTGGVDAIRIGFGRSAKLLGLSLKHLLWHPGVSQRDRGRLIPLLNVPLDSYTLQGIRLVAPELQIPSNATMKFVRNEAHYRDVQSRIKQLLPDGFHPIHYEIATWNITHPDVV